MNVSDIFYFVPIPVIIGYFTLLASFSKIQINSPISSYMNSFFPSFFIFYVSKNSFIFCFNHTFLHPFFPLFLLLIFHSFHPFIFSFKMTMQHPSFLSLATYQTLLSFSNYYPVFLQYVAPYFSSLIKLLPHLPIPFTLRSLFLPILFNLLLPLFFSFTLILLFLFSPLLSFFLHFFISSFPFYLLFLHLF